MAWGIKKYSSTARENFKAVFIAIKTIRQHYGSKRELAYSTCKKALPSL